MNRVSRRKMMMKTIASNARSRAVFSIFLSFVLSVLCALPASAVFTPTAPYEPANGDTVEDFVISDAGSLSKYTGNGGYVVIPEGVKEIAGGFSEVAYLGEAPLTGIEMPSTLTRITGLFTNQTSLTGELVIPESCSYVSSALFAGTGITKVTMLRQTNIGGNGGTLGDSGGLTTPFSKMPELKEIYIGGVFF